MHSLIFHVDVNSAFLSWESAKRLRDNPDALDLRTINAVIGGDEKMRHGVVLAKSPSAKKYGIMTGEPLSHARQKCPELVVVPPDHELYAASSRKFIEILEEVAPVIEQCSIDEAFCDMTGTEKLYGDPIAFATKLKDRIYKELGFTVNIGISTNKLFAKMASDFEKLFFRKRWRQSSGRSRWNRYTAVEKPLQKDCALLESQPSAHLQKQTARCYSLILNPRAIICGNPPMGSPPLP